MSNFIYRVVTLCLAIASPAFLVFAQVGSDYDALLQKGNAQLQAGHADLALAMGEQSIKTDGTRWEGYALAGGALMNLRQYEKAADMFSHAIDRAPEAKQATLRDLRKQCLLAEAGASPAVPAQAGTTTQAEIVLWKSIENSRNPDDFEGYLTEYPNGAFVVLAKKHLADLQTHIQQQTEQEAAARARLPITTPLFDATLVRQGGMAFLAVPTMYSQSTPFYLLSLNGEPAFAIRWRTAKKPDRSGIAFFLRNRVLLRSQAGEKSIGDSDVVLETHLHHGTNGWRPCSLRETGSDATEVIVASDNEDERVSRFGNLLLHDWDNTIKRIVFAGVDLKNLPDASTFDFDKADGAWNHQEYCMCPH